MPTKKVRSVYGKPLLSDLPESNRVESVKQEALERVGKAAIKAIQKEIRRSSWNRSPRNLLNSFTYEVKGSSVRISSDHPATEYLNRGVKPHQMTYLTKAERPIPIITETGELIFRYATDQSMRDGKWQHPGFKGKHFLERGVEAAREEVKSELASAYKKLLAEALKGKR